MKLEYNGVDITEQTKTTRCELTQYLTGHVNTLTLAFDNSADLWSQWQPMAGDVVKATEGYADSGAMVVRSIRPEGQGMVLDAAAVRYLKEGRAKAWTDVSFSQLAITVAKQTGLKLEFYGVTDQHYQTVEQKMEGDLAFLDSLCKLEGCSMQVADGKLRIISDDYLDAIEQTQYIFEAGSTRLYDEEYYSGCIVTDGTITGKWGTQKGEVITLRPNAPLSSIGEADRFAKNMLAYHNHECKGGSATTDALLSELMPGSKILLSCGYWIKKPILITKTRHELAKKRTKIWFRLVEEDDE